jgi:hypothetical protein
MHHYISCVAEKNETTAEKTARLLISYVWKLHELSSIIISDRDSQFVSLVWKTVCKILRINIKLSIAFHSETDEQSEIVNQEMKRYLRNNKTTDLNDYSWLSSRSMSSFQSQQNYSLSWQIMNLNHECFSIHSRKLTTNQRKSVY